MVQDIGIQSAAKNRHLFNHMNGSSTSVDRVSDNYTSKSPELKSPIATMHVINSIGEINSKNFYGKTTIHTGTNSISNHNITQNSLNPKSD